MAVQRDDLSKAHDAYAHQRWDEAAELFDAVDTLGPEDLAAHSDAMWWLGRMDDAVQLAIAAYRAFVAEERTFDAGRTALDIAVIHILRGDEPLANGWLETAGRIAAELPDTPLGGYFCHLVEVEGRFDSVHGPPGETMGPAAEAVLAAARRVQECGRRFGDPNLVAAGLNGEGRVLVKVGTGGDGMSCLDEAMVSVIAGDVAPTFAGYMYCNTMSACHEVVDFRRMRRWTELTEQWIDTLPAAVLFHGICRVHRIQLLIADGEWDRALEDATRLTEELADISLSVVAEAWYSMAEIHRLRGDTEDAKACYRQAHGSGRSPQPGLAKLLLAGGDPASAMSAIHSALIAAGHDALAAAHLHAAMVEIALAVGDDDAATGSSHALDETARVYDSAGLWAMADEARGRVLAAAGRTDEALSALRDAARGWNELGARYEGATASAALAHVYTAMGDSASATLELEHAATVFERLGARPAIQAVTPSPATGPDKHDGLTTRELEVLGCVAEGRSNRQVAEELYISDRTVARHLYNIFNKLGVSSRTEATRHALDRGLVDPTPKS